MGLKRFFKLLYLASFFEELLCRVVNYQPILYYEPEQVHISFGNNIEDIVVTWSTFTATLESVVHYGIGGFTNRAVGYSRKFVDGGSMKRTQYIHRVTLPGLMPKTKYSYYCGSNLGWSDEFWFITVDNLTNWSPHLAVFGDMGNVNARSLPYLQKDTHNNVYDALLHVGDFAYDMRFDDGQVGDEFMKQIEPIAAYLPYMVAPGNHEES